MEEFKVYQASGYLTKLVRDASDVRKDYEDISGSLVEFDTPIAAPLSSLLVDINPVQDLNGQDEPYPAGGGNNKFSAAWPPDVSDTYGGWKINYQNEMFCKLFDNDISVDISGIYFGFTENGISTPVTWLVVAGSIAYTSLRSSYQSYISIYPNNEETLNKLKQRFNILVTVDGGDETKYTPYSNICPITGWDEVNVYHSGEDTSDPTTYTVSWQDDAGTVYGGTIDVVSGVLTVTKVKKLASEYENWRNLTPLVDGSGYYIYALSFFPSNVQNKAISNVYKPVTGVEWESLTYGECITTTTLIATVPPEANTLPLAVDYLSTIGAYFVYELAEPIEYELTPQEINTFIGVNNIWADTGDVSVKYRTH